MDPIKTVYGGFEFNTSGSNQSVLSINAKPYIGVQKTINNDTISFGAEAGAKMSLNSSQVVDTAYNKISPNLKGFAKYNPAEEGMFAKISAEQNFVGNFQEYKGEIGSRSEFRPFGSEHYPREASYTEIGVCLKDTTFKNAPILDNQSATAKLSFLGPKNSAYLEAGIQHLNKQDLHPIVGVGFNIGF